MIPFNEIVEPLLDEHGNIVGVKGTELVFTHVHIDGTVRHFAIERMEKVAVSRSMPIMPIKTDFETWNMIRLNFGIEQHRLNRLTPEICLRKPTLWVELSEQSDNPKAMCTAIMVDGAHRYVYAYGTLGWDRIPGHLFKLGEWEEFLVDIPQELSEFDADRIRKASNGGEQFWSGIH